MNYLDKYNRFIENEQLSIVKQYAIDNNVPIITDEGLAFIMQLVQIKRAVKILEIGSAIGYCAINLALLNKQLKIDTIERNEKMYHLCLENIKKCDVTNQVNVIYANALEVDVNQLQKDYDIIFIDAAKAQYIKFFEKFSPLLASDGIIVSDNLLFHGIVADEAKATSKDLRALVRKIDNFNQYLYENEEFRTTFYNIGDGMAITMRNEK